MRLKNPSVGCAATSPATAGEDHEEDDGQADAFERLGISALAGV